MYPTFSEVKPLKKFYENSLVKNFEIPSNYDKDTFSKISKHFDIHRIEKIRNAHLYGLYLLTKEEMKNDKTVTGTVKEKILYHATSPEIATKIARNNIDWRKAKKPRFGRGTYFSENPKYANRHANKQGGAMIVFKVLVKQVEKMFDANFESEVPRKLKNDTTMANGTNVYVKYDDFACYPEFIVYYS